MDLKEYIRRVYELEKSCYTQEHFIRLLEQKLGQVQRTNFVSPVNIASIKKPEKEEVVSTCIGGMIGGAILSVIVIVVMLLTGILHLGVFLLEGVVYSAEREFLLLLNECIAIVIIGMIFGGVCSVIDEKNPLPTKWMNTIKKCNNPQSTTEKRKIPIGTLQRRLSKNAIF